MNCLLARWKEIARKANSNSCRGNIQWMHAPLAPPPASNCRSHEKKTSTRRERAASRGWMFTSSAPRVARVPGAHLASLASRPNHAYKPVEPRPSARRRRTTLLRLLALTSGNIERYALGVEAHTGQLVHVVLEERGQVCVDEARCTLRAQTELANGADGTPPNGARSAGQARDRFELPTRR